jgi:hypothetical protein
MVGTGGLLTVNEFKVVRVYFKDLEDFLNNTLETEYDEYYIYQILTESSHNESWAVVILCKKLSRS